MPVHINFFIKSNEGVKVDCNFKGLHPHENSDFMTIINCNINAVLQKYKQHENVIRAGKSSKPHPRSLYSTGVFTDTSGHCLFPGLGVVSRKGSNCSWCAGPECLEAENI